ELPVVVPPEGEANAIVGAIARIHSSIDELCAEAERAITLLQERRTALISAAVTGQIDVRGLANRSAA
ncbi:MAG: restriction endonuclease subunit S, partial [Myxococcales bacterium]